jgi:hypothetical protein
LPSETLEPVRAQIAFAEAKHGAISSFAKEGLTSSSAAVISGAVVFPLAKIEPSRVTR